MSFFDGGSGGGGPRGLLGSFGEDEAGNVKGRVLFRLLRFVRPHRLALLAAGFLMLLTTLGGLAVPFITGVIIDDYVAVGRFEGFHTMGLLLAGAAIMVFFSSMGQRTILSVVGNRVLNTLRNSVFSHLQKLSVAYNDTHITGITISRVIQDVSVINMLLSEGLITMIGDLFLIVGTISAMMIMNWRLALLSLAAVPLMILATWLFSRRAKGAYRTTREKIGAVIGDLSENIGGIKVTQAFGQEEAIHERFRIRNRENRDAVIEAMKLSFIFLPVVDVLSVLATTLVLGGGGLLIARGIASIGVVVAFMNYVNRFFMPIRELSQLFTTLQSASAGGERVLELLETEPVVSDAPNAVDITDIRGEIEFRNVDFSYEPGKPILKNISLKIEAGKTAAVVGHTGAGKTTITNLLCRFYQQQNGAVLLDGRDIREITMASYHARLGYISQDPFLFPGTVADNIRFGRPLASMQEVQAAAERTRLHDIILRLPQGYDTRIEEGGANFSAGQRQLLCIARAVLTDPAILIMDEATSSVDTVTEAMIQSALDELMKARTAVVIAHRLSTIRNADVIFTIEDGRVAESGTHEELLATDGIYRQLHEKQFIEL